jgi:hypothetical protein
VTGLRLDGHVANGRRGNGSSRPRGRLVRALVRGSNRAGLVKGKGSEMSEPPAWKKALREPNAIGWIAFFFLAVAIGVGSIYFGGSEPAGQHGQHAAK